MDKVLVLGAFGQLGQCLQTIVKRNALQGFVFPSEETGNILDISALRLLFEAEKLNFAINCAAYTAVDKAEEEVVKARDVNALGAANLAQMCEEFDCTLVHVSTDFVFKGDIPCPLTEKDVTEPINTYGITKLEGEKMIADTLAKHYIFRTSWLYSEFGNNFVKTMLKLGESRPEIKVISDQFGTPTYAMDLAECILHIIDQGSTAYGTYHYSNEGSGSWYDFAKAIFDISEQGIKVSPIKTDEYITKAVRPAFSVMDKSKIKSEFNLEIPYWRDSLTNCLNALVQLSRA